ncbi:hypothetical protein [Vibrio superstes]|uniref:Capsule polysaccharide biosynthesis protein n=1 Tax=Vibrio superstes NBRC 103154 TaxID=1219062 RepID=A0A511QU09_9VIBR|nr:hypothetical protein [Vibrio superstes]GEM80853.1 hypothetical protein VSU01S_30980 [Vibrio superstes NBRC 103154]
MKRLLLKLKKFKNITIFSVFGVELYFGKDNLSDIREIHTLSSKLYYPLFLLLVLFKNSLSKKYIVKSPSPILGENGFFDNNTLFINSSESINLSQDSIREIINITSKRNYFLLDDYTNTIFLEVRAKNLKFIEDNRLKLDKYSRVYLKVIGINRKKYKAISKFIDGKLNYVLVDKYIPSINIVSKVSSVFTDDKLSFVTYKMINGNVELLSSDNKKQEVILPKLAISLFENKLVPYEDYLIDNLLYSFVLTVPDQLIEDNLEHKSLLKLTETYKSRTSLLLASLIEFISSPTKENEDKFVDNYSLYINHCELTSALYLISEPLIINCKLDTLNRILSISMRYYIEYLLKTDGFYDFFTAVQVVTRRLSGRIVDYGFINEVQVRKLIEASNLSIRNISVLISLLIENRNDQLVKFLFENLPPYPIRNLDKLHLSIKKDFIALGVFFEQYNSHWENYLSKNHFEVQHDFHINQYASNVEPSELELREKVLLTRKKKQKFLTSKDDEILLDTYISDYQKFVLLLQRGNINGAVLANGIKTKKSFSLYSNQKSRADTIRHISTSNKILLATENESTKQDTIIIDISLGCMNSKTQFFALFPWINASSIQFTSLLNAFSIKTKDIDDQLDKINREFNADWLLQTIEYIDIFNVNIEEKIISSKGVNYFHGFYEASACSSRTYDVDYNLDINQVQFITRVRRASILLTYLDRVYTYARNNKKKLIFIGGNSHLAPYSCIRDYILSKNSEYMNFVAIGAAYENYYSNFSTNYSKCFGIVNQSFNPKIRAAFLPEKNKFESWLALNPENKDIVDKVNALIKVNRNFSQTPVCNELITKIRKHRDQGKKTVCCFGKIVFDSAVPFDGGPAHSGFKDWLNHTIEIAQSSPELLVLIKPHPHELKVEIAMKIGQYLRDLIPQSLPDNVIFLDHESFNTYEIAQIVDLAVLWNGTSSMELTSLGVPVMMCGHFGLFDYHLELIYPKDRNDYASKLLDTQNLVIDEKLKYRAMAYVSYMGHHETAIPNQYARRQLLNDPVGIPIWHEEKLRNLVELDDAHMEYALKKILHNTSTQS